MASVARTPVGSLSEKWGEASAVIGGLGEEGVRKTSAPKIPLFCN